MTVGPAASSVSALRDAAPDKAEIIKRPAPARAGQGAKEQR